jgi:hypothetical protein
MLAGVKHDLVGHLSGWTGHTTRAWLIVKS